MRRALVPIVTLTCLCCATLPRPTRTDLQIAGGLAHTQWTESTPACSGFPPARQLDDQVQAGIAVVHQNATGLELGGSLEAVRETVTRSVNHPSPPDGARDSMLGGGAYVGVRRQNVGTAVGGVLFGRTLAPYFTLELGSLDKIWLHVQLGRWRPFTDARVASIGGVLRPFPGGELELWFGEAASGVYAYPVATRMPGQSSFADAKFGGGLNLHLQVSEVFALVAQVVASETPSGSFGISITPSKLVEQPEKQKPADPD